MPFSHGRSQVAPSTSKGRSLLDTRHLSKADILSLFQEADELEKLGQRHGVFYDPQEVGRTPKVVGCLFFEPSTRTRMSFQTAAYRLGHRVLTMELSAGSSLSKGETQTDTVLNVAAMGPDALVIRYGNDPQLDELLPQMSIPVINAGNGTMAHPTQGLLDAYAIQREKGSLAGQRILVVGDVRFSRVARSNFDVLAKLGAEIGICGPEALLPEPTLNDPYKRFTDLDDALAWPTVYMGLRIQLERHAMAELKMQSLADYHREFGLSAERLKKLAKDAIIMHPGPINRGVEFAEDVMKDSRCRVLDQVGAGVLVRAALLNRVLV